MAVSGTVEAAKRARGWMPRLATNGQRLTLASMVLFVDKDLKASPTNGQLSKVTSYHSSSVRRILRELEAAGALSQVGSRPVQSADGAKGGRIIIWSIPPAPSDAHMATRAPEGAHGDSQARPVDTPPAPHEHAKRAPGGAPLRVEEVEAAAVNQAIYDAALLIAEAKGARDTHAVARTIIEQDPEDSIVARAAVIRSKAVGQSPSPRRNDPADCLHRAIDTEGWCAACSSQVHEVAS